MQRAKKKNQQQWDKARVIAAIHTAFPHGVGEPHDRLAVRNLARVGKRYFGSWPAALMAAGLLAPGEPVPQFKTWPRSRILEAIRVRHSQGLPLNSQSDKNLANVARKRFGSWQAAVQAAGLPPDVKIRTQQRWTREKLLAEIRVLHKQGETQKGTFHRDHANVSSSARVYFGGWHQALIAAGILPPNALPKRQKPRTKAELLDALQSCHRQSLSLLCTAPHNRHLYYAAYLHFGGWQKALAAAGIPREDIPGSTRRSLSPEEVLTTLRAHYAAGKGLPQLRQENRALLYAAQKFFGSWLKAIYAAGLPAQQSCAITPQTLLQTLQTLKQQGHSLQENQVLGSLRYAAKKHFGSWLKALVQAGLLDPEKCQRRWTKAEILQEICRWHQEGRKTNRQSLSYRRLWQAATRKFGSWNLALRAAQVSLPDKCRWSPQKVLDELRMLFPQGICEEYHPPIPPKLQGAAKMYFGSLRGAMQTAGLLRDDQCLGRERKWSHARIIAAIQDRYVRRLPLYANRDYALAGATVRRFGGWQNALEAAGVPKTKYGYQPRQWTAALVQERIQAGYRQGGRTMQIQRAEKGLASAATRYFGSWHQALVAAGIRDANTPPPMTEKWSPQRVLQEIRDCYQQGRPRRVAGSRLYSAAERYFSGWQKALAAAGLVDSPQLRWERKRQEVIEKLRAWAQHSSSLSSTQAPRQLASAARYYWGSWDCALAAAGLEEQYLFETRCRRWNPQKVLVAIRARQRRGLLLTRVYQEDKGLYGRARWYFGSWQQALIAAGIVSATEEIRAKGKGIRK